MLDREFEIPIAPGANLPSSLPAGFNKTPPEKGVCCASIPVTGLRDCGILAYPHYRHGIDAERSDGSRLQHR